MAEGNGVGQQAGGGRAACLGTEDRKEVQTLSRGTVKSWVGVVEVVLVLMSMDSRNGIGKGKKLEEEKRRWGFVGQGAWNWTGCRTMVGEESMHLGRWIRSLGLLEQYA